MLAPSLWPWENVPIVSNTNKSVIMPKSKNKKSQLLSCVESADLDGLKTLIEEDLSLAKSFVLLCAETDNSDLLKEAFELELDFEETNLEEALLIALDNGNLKTAKLINEKCGNLDYVTAAGIGDIDRLAEFFDNSNNLRISDDDLVEFGTSNMTKTLVKPLMVACKNGQLEVAFYLIRKGADINLYILEEEESDILEASGLHWAAKYGHYELVKFLINYGAKIYCKDTKFDLTPAQWALEEGHEQIHKYISYLQKV